MVQDKPSIKQKIKKGELRISWTDGAKNMSEVGKKWMDA